MVLLRHILFFRASLVSIFLFFLLGQFGRISLFGYQISGYAYEVAMAVLFVYFIIIHKEKGVVFLFEKVPFLILTLSYTFTAFILTAFLYTPTDNVISILYMARIIFSVLFFSYFFLHLKRYKNETEFLRSVLIITAAAILFVSFLQYFFFPNIRPLMAFGWDPHLYRMTGTFLEPAFACAVYGVLFYFLLFQEKKSRILGILMILLSLCVLLTVSRAGMAAFLVSTGIYLVLRKLSMRYLLIVIGGLILGSTVFGFSLYGKSGEGMNLLRTSTIQSRVENYQEAFQIWRQYPIFGVGYNRIAVAKEDFSVPERTRYDIQMARSSFHSTYLIILVTTGGVGLIAFLYLLVIIGRQSHFHAIVVSFLSIFALFDNILLHPFVMFLFFITGSLVLVTLPSRTSH